MILSRYVGKSSAYAIFGTTLLLVVVQTVFKYISQFADFSQVYTPLDGLYYVLWGIPQTLYDLLPMTSLIGVVIGLSMLAGYSETTVMRATGVSLWKIVRWAIRPLLVLMVAALILSQYVLPHTNAMAASMRADPKNASAAVYTGYWTKINNQFVYVNFASEQGTIRTVKMIQLTDENRLEQVTDAPSATPVATSGQQAAASQRWHLNQPRTVQVSPKTGNATYASRPVQTLQLGIKPQDLHLVTVDPEYLSPTQLYKVIQRLDQQGVNSKPWKLEFWKKLTMPAAMLGLAVLASSFVFGSLRSQTIGFRIVVALSVGIAFTYIDNLAGYASLAYNGSPGWYIVIPILVVWTIALIALKRAS